MCNQQCKNQGNMGEFGCNDPSQCWEPCGDLGKDERYVRRASPESEKQLNRLIPHKQGK